MKKPEMPHELPCVLIACATCSDMGHEQNCYPPDEIAWIGGAWICAECWESTDEGAAGDADAFDKALKARAFVKPARPLPPEKSEAAYIARAVAALEG